MNCAGFCLTAFLQKEWAEGFLGFYLGLRCREERGLWGWLHWGVLKRFLFLIIGIGWFIAKEIATRDVAVIVSSLLMGERRAYTYDTGAVVTGEAAQHSWESVRS